MSDVQIEAIVKAALAQAEQRVEACVVFLDAYTGAALADLVLAAHRWSICVADDYTLARALGAALRFPDLEIVVCLYVDESNRHQVQRGCALTEETALTNVSLFACGPAAEQIDGIQLFDCPPRARVYIDPWVACPVHTQQFAFDEDDCEEPRLFLQRIRTWAAADSLIEIWDAHQYGDVMLTLIAAAQYAAQGRQVWTVLETSDLADPELIDAARAIGQAQLPLKCLTVSALDGAGAIPWSQWARLRGWWVHAPADGAEARAWMQSTLDHLWPALVCLPERWLSDLEPLRFAAARHLDNRPHSVCAICMPHMLAVCRAAREALASVDIDLGIQVVSSLAPLSQLLFERVDYICVIDNAVDAPLSDIVLPQLRGMRSLHFDICGPQQCQGQTPQAADIAACIRRAAGI